jgi:ATP-dependent Clp protease, protease subunit
MEGHIFVYGIIVPFQDSEASNYGEVNLKDINNQLSNNKEADTLLVHINSMGGDVFEGYAIHDVLQATGKKIITQAEGLVASIATVIFLAGEERRITENSELMVHNPWGFAGGDSSQVQKYADQLKKEESKLAEFYANKTGSTKEDMLALMKEETYMTAQDAIKRNFATSIAEKIKAVAQLNTIQMTEKEVNEKIEESSKGIFSKITAFLKKSGIIKALVLKTADNKDLDFGDSIQDAGEIVVGSEAKVDGKAAEGDFLMPDGVTYVFVAGKVTEIKPKEEENEEVEALKTENESLKSQLSAAQALLTDVQKDLTAFKAQITSDIKGLKNENPGDPEPAIRKPFKK